MPRLALLTRAAALVALLPLTPALAQTTVWTGAGGNANWGNSGNWTAGTPNSNTLAVFGTAVTPGAAIQLNTSGGLGNFTGSLSIAATGSFSLGLQSNANPLTFSAGNNITRAASAAGTHDLGRLQLDGPDAPGTFNINGSGFLRLRGFITESFANFDPVITKSGSGKLIVGQDDITSVPPGSQFRWDGSLLHTAGSLEFDGSGPGVQVVSSGLNVTVNPGLTSVVRSYSLGVQTLSGAGPGGVGALQVIGGYSYFSRLHAAANATYSVDASTIAETQGFSTASASVTLTKIGTGTVVVGTNSPSLTGLLRFEAGVVELDCNNPFGNAASVHFASGATLSHDPFTNQPATITSPVTASGTGSASQGALHVAQSRTLTLSGSLTLPADVLVNPEVGATLALTGPVNQTGGTRTLTKTGGGTLSLTGPAGSFSPNLVASLGVVEASGSVFSSSTNITLQPNATLQLTANSVLSRPLSIGGVGVAGVIGVFRALGNALVTSTVLIPSSSATVRVDAGSLIFSGPVQASANLGLTKIGAGTLALSSPANNFSFLNINEGVLSLSSDVGIPANVTTTVAAGAEVQFGSATFSRPLVLAGDGTDGNGVIKNLGGPSTVSSPITFTAPSSLAVNAGTLSLTGTLQGAHALTKTGPGKLIVSGAIASPSVLVSAGTLLLATDPSAPPSLSVTVPAGSTLEVSSTYQGNAALTIAGNGTAGSGAIRVASGTTGTLAGPLTLSASATVHTPSGTAITLRPAVGAVSESAPGAVLTKTGPGTLTLGGTNTLTGGLAVAAGTVRTASDISLGAPAAPVSVAGGARLTFTSSTSTARTFSGEGALAAEAAATVTLSGATLSDLTLRGPGLFEIAAGTLLLNAKPFVGSNLRVSEPASFSQLTSDANLTVDAPSSFDGLVNGPFGTLAVNAPTTAADFGNAGVLTIPRDSALTVISSDLVSSGGSRITIGTPSNPGGLLDLSGNSLVLNGALLTNNGTIAGPTIVNYGSTAKGAGNFGPVTVTDGGVFSPGNSPAAVTTGPVIWAPGGSYVFEIMNAAGTPGAAYDTWNVQGLLDITAGATANSDFNIVVTTLSSPTTPGPMSGFLPHRPWGWPILTTSSPITTFDPSKVTLDVSGFQNDLGNGTLRLQLTADRQTLLLTYFPGVIPEPAAVGLLLPSLLLLRRRR